MASMTPSFVLAETRTPRPHLARALVVMAVHHRGVSQNFSQDGLADLYLMERVGVLVRVLGAGA